MKNLFGTILLALFALSGMAQTGKIHCHIEGQLVRKPDCEKLLLLPEGCLPNFVKSDRVIEVNNGTILAFSPTAEEVQAIIEEKLGIATKVNE